MKGENMKDTTKKIVTEKAEYDMELRKKLEKKTL